MKKFSIRLLLCSIVGLLAFNSCLKDDNDNTPIPNGLMVYVNAFPEEDALHYYVDGRSISNNLAPVAYKSYTATRLFTGKRNLKVTPYHSNITIIDSTLTIKDSIAYTSFVYGTKEVPVFAVAEDKGIQGLGNKFGLRYFNLANKTEGTNLFVGDDTEALFSNRALETGESVVTNQAFVATETTKSNLIVKDNAGKELAKREFTFQKGRYYTIMLTGVKDDPKTPLYIGVIALQ